MYSGAAWSHRKAKNKPQQAISKEKEAVAISIFKST